MPTLEGRRLPGHGLVAPALPTGPQLPLQLQLRLLAGCHATPAGLAPCRPIKVLRLVVAVFVVTFYIASFNIFLVALDCQYFDPDPAKRWHMSAFPQVGGSSWRAGGRAGPDQQSVGARMQEPRASGRPRRLPGLRRAIDS
jgi:hypothetical protein